MQELEPKLYDESITEEEKFSIIKHNMSATKEFEPEKALYMSYLRRLFCEDPGEMVHLFRKYQITEEFTWVYSHIVNSPTTPELETLIIDCLAIISNLFYTNDKDLLEYFAPDQIDAVRYFGMTYINEQLIIQDVLMACGNIAGSKHTRDMLFHVEYFTIINRILFKEVFKPSIKTIKSIAWGIRVFCKDELPEDKENEVLQQIIEILNVLISVQDDNEIKLNVLIAVQNLTQNHDILCIIETNLVNKILYVLQTTNNCQVSDACLKALGGIASSDCNEPINMLIKEGILDKLYEYLKSNDSPNYKNAFWITSNIAATKNICNSKMFSTAVSMMENEVTVEIMNELITVVSNTVHNMVQGAAYVEDEITALNNQTMLITEETLSMELKKAEGVDYFGENRKNISFLVRKSRVLDNLIKILECKHSSDMIAIALECLIDIYDVANFMWENLNDTCFIDTLNDEFKELNASDILSKLVDDSNQDISERATKLLEFMTNDIDWWVEDLIVTEDERLIF